MEREPTSHLRHRVLSYDPGRTSEGRLHDRTILGDQRIPGPEPPSEPSELGILASGNEDRAESPGPRGPEGVHGHLRGSPSRPEKRPIEVGDKGGERAGSRRWDALGTAKGTAGPFGGERRRNHETDRPRTRA